MQASGDWVNYFAAILTEEHSFKVIRSRVIRSVHKFNNQESLSKMKNFQFFKFV